MDFLTIYARDTVIFMINHYYYYMGSFALSSRKCLSIHSCDDVVFRLRGQQLTLPYIIENGFNNPILVEDKTGLDLIAPHDSFNVLDVENYVGECDFFFFF